MADKTDIKSLNFNELKAEMEAVGEKPYRADQIYGWMHQKYARGFQEMSNLPKALRASLEERYDCLCLEAVSIQRSKLDGTCKYLFALPDGQMVESVLMHYRHGNSVCISSQAGCRMGCRFCASTIGGLARNLTASEMLDQIYMISMDTGERVSNVVVMGTGEPLDNFDNLVRFISMLGDERGPGISLRNITVSTCGIVPGIRRLAEYKLPITLALSLHAPDQAKRAQIMPVAKKYSLDDVMDACIYYHEMTGRRMTLEYSLIRGFNDTPEDVIGLAGLARRLGAHVNLIPVNPVGERPYKSPGTAAVTSFKNKLEKSGINVTIRREMGRDIDGACGQLRRRYAEEKSISPED